MNKTSGTCLSILPFLLIIPAVAGFCQADPAVYPTKIRNEIRMTGNDSIKIEKLFDLAFFYSDYLGDDRLADSLGREAIQLAQVSHRPEWIFHACHRYIETNNIHSNYQLALGYALKALQVSPGSDPGIAFRNYQNLVSVYLSGYEYDKALEFSYKALSIAATADNVSWKTRSYMDIGRALEGKNQKIEAFRNYLNAINLAEKAGRPDLLTEGYSLLSHYYNMNRIYGKATHYKLLQRDLLLKKRPVDSVALLWTVYDLQVIDLNSNNNFLDEKSMGEILGFAGRIKHRRMLNEELALIRSHLIEAEKIGQLHDLYHRQFPGELQRLVLDDPGLFYKLKAFFCEAEDQPDSALYYFNRAENILQSDPNVVLQSGFYNRFGQFLVRRGMNDKAVEKFLKSYELAQKASYFDYMSVASRQLESIYAGKKDYRNAYRYSLLNKMLSDSINKSARTDQLLIMEIDYETRQRENAAEAEHQATIRRHYLQYTGMIILIISIFVVLLMLGSLKVPGWIIRMMGFFSFIFLFEFIILVADHKIHEVTQGEPWKILLIKIFLIAILLPLHHWIEKRVIAFLLNPTLINISRYPLHNRLKETLRAIIRK